MNAQNKTLFALKIADIEKSMSNTIERLKVGTHEIEETITLNIKGTVTVGEDYDQRIVAKADPWLLLEVALSKLNGVTIDSLVRDAANKELDTKATKLKADATLFALQTANDKKEYELAVKKATEAGEAIDKIKMGTWTKCDGKVTKKLFIELVEQEQAV